MSKTAQTFTATLQIIGINPYVSLPQEVLETVFSQSRKDKGPIPVKGTINGDPYTQTLVKYRGEWRLYINTRMLKDSPQRIGETLELSVMFDPVERVLEPHPKLVKALEEHQTAKEVFDNLPAYLQKEIIRYLAHLKSEKSIADNIEKAIGFLEGRNRFIGRDPINQSKE
jgi:hypothetical protein